eukprot:11523537-Prorocentrum_lima.AAC.1
MKRVDSRQGCLCAKLCRLPPLLSPAPRAASLQASSLPLLCLCTRHEGQFSRSTNVCSEAT